jgi:protein involved in polysaccharide export with SLBB domain
MGRDMTPEQLRNLAGSSSAYRMGAGDVLDIDISGVWQQPDIRTQTALNADGILDIGKLGAYRLQGLTVAQAQRVLRTACWIAPTSAVLNCSAQGKNKT